MKKTTLLLCVCMIGILSVTTSSAQDVTEPVLKYSAKDSTKYSADKKIISLFGDAKVVAEKFSVVPDELTYDSGSSFLIKLKGENYELIK